MTPKLASSFIALLALTSSAVAQFTTSYSLNLNPGTSAGNPVTHIMILEASADGSQLFIDYGGAPNAYTVNGAGFYTITHASAFNPAMSLIIGLTQQVQKTSLVIFMNEAFAANAAGKPYNQSFFATNHPGLIDHVLGVGNGTAADLDWFRTAFWPTDGTRAAFATGTTPTAVEFTTGMIISAPEHANTALLLALGCAILLGARRSSRSIAVR